MKNHQEISASEFVNPKEMVDYSFAIGGALSCIERMHQADCIQDMREEKEGADLYYARAFEAAQKLRPEEFEFLSENFLSFKSDDQSVLISSSKI